MMISSPILAKVTRLWFSGWTNLECDYYLPRLRGKRISVNMLKHAWHASHKEASEHFPRIHPTGIPKPSR